MSAGAAGRSADLWALRRYSRPGAQLRLFCLPHAGGDTWMFGDWHLALPTNIEVCPVRLPGRGSRMSDPPFTDLDALAAALAAGLADLFDRPFAIFGHSMGALIGMALARRLRQERGLHPALLCVAACRAPHLARLEPAISQLPPYTMLQELQQRFGRGDDLANNEDLMRLVLPTLRADLAICESFDAGADAPLDCPIVAYGGSADAMVGLQALDDWEPYTTGPFRRHVLEGDHFFPIEAKAELLPVLSNDLAWSMP